MSGVKRYDAVHLRYEDSNIRYGEGCEVEVVTSADHDREIKYCLDAGIRAQLERDTLRTAKQRLEGEVARLKADSARYQFLKENCQQDVDGYRNETPVLVHALSHIPEWRDRIDETIDAALAGKAGDV